MYASNLEYLKELARRARGLPATVLPAEAPGNAGLAYFRRVIIENPDVLRRKVLGANALRLKNLGATRRACSRVLDTSPDLLSPLGELRYEPSHTKLIGYFLSSRHQKKLAHRCTDALLRLLNIKDEVLEVTTEHMCASGRVDICISMKQTLVFIEVKVDAPEGQGQLEGYRTALLQQKSTRTGVLVYLSLATGATLSCEPDRRLSFEELLQAWLPVAVGDTSEQEYLGRYLKSIALLVGAAEPGDFYGWSFAAQRACVSLLEDVFDEQD